MFLQTKANQVHTCCKYVCRGEREITESFQNTFHKTVIIANFHFFMMNVLL